mgnify:CR=1 FL=1
MKLDLPDQEPYRTIPYAIYDDVELNPCVFWQDGAGQNSFEPVGSPAEAQALVDKGEAAGWVWSLYWHCTNGGVQHVADFPSCEPFHGMTANPADLQEARTVFAALKCAVNVARGDRTSMAAAIEYGSYAVGVTDDVKELLVGQGTMQDERVAISHVA